MGIETGPILLNLARAAIARQLGIYYPEPDCNRDPLLSEPGATFVTLTHNGNLRGCIGSLEAKRPLSEDVMANAVNAAFHDPRFTPLQDDELNVVEVEVSLLSPVEPITFASENEALGQLRPGVDGVVLQFGQYRATFLPQVWEQLPEPRAFVARLKRKAGLPEHFWSPEIILHRYTVTKWKESDYQRELPS